MRKEVRELRIAIAKKKEEARSYLKENKIDDAKACKEEIEKMQDRLEIMEALDDDTAVPEVSRANEGDINDAFVAAVKACITGKKLSDKQIELLNSVKEGVPADGGLIVPKDISTTIKELRRGQDALEEIVNVEKVTTLSGSRVIEKNAAITPFDNVDEEAQFGDAGNPQFENVEYKLSKKGGILKVSAELLEDSTENVTAYLNKWLGKKQKATRNALILASLNTATSGKEVAVKTVDDLKKIFNVTLDPAIRETAIVLTNQDGLQWLDTLVDKDGKYLMQPNITEPTKMMLFGKYPIRCVSNAVLTSGSAGGGKSKYPFFIGDLVEGVTLFDRDVISIEASKVAGDLWNKDQTGIKARERLDCKIVDAGAFVKAEFTTA